MQRDISADFPFSLKRARVHDAEMAYADIGEGYPIVFLHGNPTSSHTWRNVIPRARGKHYSDVKHYLPEDCPHEIGETAARFVKEVRSASWKADTAS
jgi:pimeloyl-ACP methyl ester carboxylesterase